MDEDKAAPKKSHRRELRDRAAQGDAEAQYELATLYFVNEGAPRDAAKAMGFLLQAAEQGHVEAQTLLGVVLVGVDDVPSDLDASMRWLEKAAEGGGALAMAYLADRYALGADGVEKDEQKGRAWLRRAAIAGHPGALTEHGRQLLKDGSKEGPAMILRAAEQGFAEAQFLAGVLHLSGRGLTLDVPAGLRMLSLAVEQQHAEAAFMLSKMFETGEHVEQSDEDALKMLALASSQGHEEAQALLEAKLTGAMNPDTSALEAQFAEEQRAKLDAQIADVRALIQREIDNDTQDPETQFVIGEAFEAGLIFEKDLKKAREWYARAAAQDWLAAKAKLAN